jgi:hypothetical protein
MAQSFKGAIIQFPRSYVSVFRLPYKQNEPALSLQHAVHVKLRDCQSEPEASEGEEACNATASTSFFVAALLSLTLSKTTWTDY